MAQVPDAPAMFLSYSFKVTQMSIDIRMPKLPGGSPNGTLRRWLKDAGENVAQGEVLLEVETERQVVELEASCAARIGFSP